MTLIDDHSTANLEKTLPLGPLAELEWMIAKEWIGLVMQHRDKTLSTIPLHQPHGSKKIQIIGWN